MAHSSFELVNLSKEKQLAAIQEEMAELSDAISEEKSRQGKAGPQNNSMHFKKICNFVMTICLTKIKKTIPSILSELGVGLSDYR
ncbi:MAG: hypothetical protein ACLTQG_30365 [Hungatella sp.]|uniref:hypothetical protein n=1 Tax=Hungatella sp. TaxID=2613924 RepID=UPI0039944255